MSVKTKRMNKTKNNLIDVKNHLDDASGSLYNAKQNLGMMVGIEEDETELGSIEAQLDRIDISNIDNIKQKVEELIRKKEEE